MTRRKCLVLGVILLMSCSEKMIPPTGPEQAKPGGPAPDRVEINDPGPGGGGSGGTLYWDYTWVHATVVNNNYGADCPGTNCNGHANPATDWLWDQADRKFTWQNGSADPFIPHLIDQDSKADQVALAKALVYMCDGTPPKKFYYADSVSYYDEVWHAIRNMMKDHRSYPYSDSTLCKNGWIGIARNLMGYVIAADYLMSQGPVSNRGYRSQLGQTYESACGGLPCCDNSKTRDSLKTFLKVFLDESDTAWKAPSSASCAKLKWLRSDMAAVIPDNKGAAAMASMATVAALGWNMQVNRTIYSGHGTWPQPSPSYESYFDNVRHYLKGWAGDRGATGHAFPSSGYDAGDGSPRWALTWTQEDSLAPVPILGPAETARWPFPTQGGGDCIPPGGDCLWSSDLFGLPVEDLLRAGTVHEVCQSQPPEGPCPPFFALFEGHVAGVINYLVNTAEVIYLEDATLDSFTYNSDIIPQTAIWYETWADLWASTEWPNLRESEDDWPCSFIVNQKGYSVVDGYPASRKLGKQMSFTDLTHP